MASPLRQQLDGCWYGEAYGPPTMPGYCVSPTSGALVKTERGPVNTDYPLLFTRGMPGKFAGQASAPTPIGNIEVLNYTGPGKVVGVGYGINTVMYLRDGTLVQGAPQYGAQGLRYQAADGSIVTADATHISPDGLLADYTELGGVRIGQNQQGSGCLVQMDPTKPDRLVLESGDCQFIRVNYYSDTDSWAVGIVKLSENRWVGYWVTRAELAALPPYIVVPPPITVPPIAKPCILAWFSDVTTPAPANCTLAVNFHNPPVNDNLLRYADRTPFAALVDSEVDLPTLESAIAAKRAQYPTLPIVAYWPRKFWGQHCSADYYGVEAYWHVDESIDQFQSVVTTEAQAHGKVWLVAQAYNSNAGNTPNTAAVVPVVAQITRSSDNINGILPFSAGSRAGGWNDLDAATQQAWQELFNSITGVPVIPQVGPTPPIPIPIPPQPLTEGDLLQMFTSIDPSKIIVAYSAIPSKATPGCFNLTVDAAGTVFSAHGDTRPPGTDGPWEAGQPTGAGVYTYWADGKAFPYGVVMVDKLPK